MTHGAPAELYARGADFLHRLAHVLDCAPGAEAMVMGCHCSTASSRTLRKAYDPASHAGCAREAGSGTLGLGTTCSEPASLGGKGR